MYDDLVLSVAAGMQDLLAPIIRDPAQIAQLAEAEEHKGGEHYAYALDALAHRELLGLLERAGYRGRVFSEEGGWHQLGDDSDVLICDPYDNTSLTLDGVRESSVAITLADAAGRLKSVAIADLQIDRVVWASADATTRTLTRTDDGWHPVTTAPRPEIPLDKAKVSVSLMKPKRRRDDNPDLRLLPRVGTLVSIDGAIMIARVAAGELDGYVDSHVGQPIYEVACCELICRAGGRVTDADGRPFSLAEVIATLESEPGARYRLIAARTPELHRAIVTALRGSP